MTFTGIVNFGSAPFEIIDGDRGKNYPRPGEFSDDGFCLFLNASNVTRNGFDFSQCQFITEQKDNVLRKGRLLREDVVLTTRGTIGNTAFYSESVPYENLRINSGMVILRCNHKRILPIYLYHFLRSSQFHGQVNALRSGVAQPQLPIRDMRVIKLPLPSVHKQQSIVNILSAYDELIENNRRRIKLLEEAARQLYTEWFVRFRFPGYEHAKIITGIPDEWRRTTLGEIAGIQKGKNITKAVAEHGDVPVVAGGLKPAYYHSTANVLGPVITVSASGANAGHVSLYHIDIWASDCSFLSAAQNAEIWFLYLLMKSNQVKITGMQQGAAQPHVYPKHLEQLSIVFPSQDVREFFNEKVDAAFRQIAVLERQNRMLSRARDLLLPRLMSGEIAA